MGCAEALERFEHYREQVKDYGVDPKKNFAGSTKSLNDLFDNHYIPRYAQIKKKSWKEDRDLYKLHVRQFIGKRSAENIGPDDIEVVLAPLEQAGKLHTARKTLAVLKKMFNWAASRASARQPGSGPLLSVLNPCIDVELQKPPNSEKRNLKQEEIKIIWNHLGDKKGVDRILKLLILTGCRVSEICEMHSEEIDWIAGDLILQPERTKSNRLHIVPLTPRMKEIIGQKKSGYVFPARSKLGHTTDSGVRIALGKYCKQLKIDHLSPNDFRDNFISHMARIGVIEEYRDRLTNHANSSVDGKHYNAHDYYDEKVDALSKWDEEIERIVNSS
jgi:integrase